MKHLLITLISILLLSSPVIGDNHKSETLYRWGEYPDFKWMGFGDKDTHPVYKGDVKNGKPNGHGTLTTPYGGKYVGGWKNGRPHGQGINSSTDGNKYVGMFKDGKRNGQGIWTWSSVRQKYEGEWKDGKRTGQGTSTYPNGDKYVGEYKDVKIWNGTRYYKDGNIKYKIVYGEWYHLSIYGEWIK